LRAKTIIIEIEYHKGDVLLTGMSCGMADLKRQLAEFEKLYDRENDNFTALLCRRFGWMRIQTDEPPDYFYDHDMEILCNCRR